MSLYVLDVVACCRTAYHSDEQTQLSNLKNARAPHHAHTRGLLSAAFRVPFCMVVVSVVYFSTAPPPRFFCAYRSCAKRAAAPLLAARACPPQNIATWIPNTAATARRTYAEGRRVPRERCIYCAHCFCRVHVNSRVHMRALAIHPTLPARTLLGLEQFVSTNTDDGREEQRLHGIHYDFDARDASALTSAAPSPHGRTAFRGAKQYRVGVFSLPVSRLASRPACRARRPVALAHSYPHALTTTQHRRKYSAR